MLCGTQQVKRLFQKPHFSSAATGPPIPQPHDGVKDRWQRAGLAGSCLLPLAISINQLSPIISGG